MSNLEKKIKVGEQEERAWGGNSDVCGQRSVQANGRDHKLKGP